MGRHRRVSFSDTEEDYSESDVSMAQVPRRQHYRRRSVSRTRESPSYSTAYLSPNTLHEDVRIHRSASTGGARRIKRERELERERERDTQRERIDRERDRDRVDRLRVDRERVDRERDHVQPTAVYVDIKNDSRNTSSNKNRKQHREQASHHLEDNTYIDPYEESEDETRLRRPRRRPRASTSAVHSREPSPLHVPPPPRDFELVLEQRILEQNDQRQDIELLRQQQEIERLERHLARQRADADGNDQRQDIELFRQQQEIERLERHLARQRAEREETRVVKKDKEEDDHYEVGINDRLLRLQKYEEQERQEEEKRKAERRYRLQRLEKAEREAAEQEEVRQKLRQESLKELQRKLDEEEERERIKKEIRDEEARLALAEQEKRAKEAAMKQAAVDEWKLAEERRRIAEREAALKRDKEFRERLRLEFGYTEEEIEDIIHKRHKKDKKEDKKEKEKEEKKKDEKEKDKKKEKEEEIEQRKATWIKVHRKHLLPETLIAYQIPWSFDELDGNYIIIKTWISEEMQEDLFAHTRRLREGKLVTQTSSSLTELRVNDRNKDKMYLVRKKSPRRSWMFT
ncbi:hypothetical protein BJX99DRAFT_4755 [Aspergillus californicus]